jgi:superfamily I DNA and/or RNA helicase
MICDLLVLDEASQMNLPEALMAALALKPEGQLIVVGDHRQMPPIVKHDWDTETRRNFRQYQVYASLFDTLRLQQPPMIQSPRASGCTRRWPRSWGHA